MVSKKMLLVPMTAALLAVGALGAVTAYADTQPPAQTAITTDAGETSTEPVEANEPALPGGGHDDGPNANVDNQFDGTQ